MAKISHRDIQATALLVIKQHGGSAAYYAAGRADELFEHGALTGAAVWRRIVRLLAMEPEGAMQ
jgi:hypothetical protein